MSCPEYLIDISEELQKLRQSKREGSATSKHYMQVYDEVFKLCWGHQKQLVNNDEVMTRVSTIGADVVEYIFKVDPPTDKDELRFIDGVCGYLKRYSTTYQAWSSSCLNSFVL